MDIARKPKQSSVSVVVIRKDGTREDLGIVSYFHENPLRRMRYAALRALGRRVDDSFFTGADESDAPNNEADA